ncbi:MAG: hypothetical protein JRI63_02025 [Deltaproteobacteria bacterium]|nr:hypothetical protein [Deltaproteobacteria bacterium]MBW1957303.1 hypothetical protein [Deltaproteobacteria bacterium]MBW2012420.1 hypothetical protein [Deltaproteobacteria bacterium]MBW2088612.1 hypothetical protein [Deltaproteobacteria bacterium]OQY12819.1 MAG: hypothetical protein B6I30_04020 [Desulfobacteraceae bacterium 4572_187]
MISSPCANCQKKNQPKEKCAKDCEILQAIQCHQALYEKESIFQAIDYAEEGRFCLNNVELNK